MGGDTYWITDPREIECLASQRRQEILDRLVSMESASVRELAHVMRTDVHGLYHHVRKLLDVGLVVEAPMRAGDRRERRYAARARRLMMRRAFEDAANHPSLARVAGALTKQLEQDYVAGLKSPRAVHDGPGRTLGITRLVGSPDEDELARINAALATAMEIFWGTAGRAGDAISIGLVISPLADHPGKRPA